MVNIACYCPQGVGVLIHFHIYVSFGSKLDCFCRGHSYTFLGLFLKVKVQNGKICLGVSKISNIFGVCLIFIFLR